jgi:lysozyme family protein
MKDNFEKSLELVLQSEGGFQTQSADSGNHLSDGRAGSTNLGVTQANWESFLGHPVTWNDMKALTPATVSPFYKKKYWDMVFGDELPTPIDFMMFDFAVNHGVGGCIKVMQGVVGVQMDGGMGPQTLNAIKAVPIDQLIQRFSDAKEAYYKSLNNPTYQAGWLNRVVKVENEALNMIA